MYGADHVEYTIKAKNQLEKRRAGPQLKCHRRNRPEKVAATWAPREPDAAFELPVPAHATSSRAATNNAATGLPTPR